MWFCFNTLTEIVMGQLSSKKIALVIGLGLTSTVTIGAIGSVLYSQDKIHFASPVASANERSLEENRASLVLAANFIAQNQGNEALEQLSELEQSYPLLKPYILLKRGQAYQLAGYNRQAAETWNI